MSATILYLPPPVRLAIPAAVPDHGDTLTVNGIAVGTSHWPQPQGHENHTWTAWYADDEPDDCGGMDFGHGPTQDRAIANLFFRFPREDR